MGRKQHPDFTAGMVNETNVKQILDGTVQRQDLCIENLLETLEEQVRRVTSHPVKFVVEHSSSRQFPKFDMHGNNYSTLYPKIFINTENNYEAEHPQVLLQICIAVVLSCTTSEFIDSLKSNDTVKSFATEHKYLYSLACDCYQKIDSKLISLCTNELV